jgi:hypothetical protein
MLTSRVKAGGAATIVMSHRDHALGFTTAGLLPLPGGRGQLLGEAVEYWPGRVQQPPAGDLTHDLGERGRVSR